jgi:high-affinity Fe2+/Pb2+ permease
MNPFRKTLILGTWIGLNFGLFIAWLMFSANLQSWIPILGPISSTAVFVVSLLFVRSLEVNMDEF